MGGSYFIILEKFTRLKKRVGDGLVFRKQVRHLGMLLIGKNL
jgi:hypothetical protein